MAKGYYKSKHVPKRNKAKFVARAVSVSRPYPLMPTAMKVAIPFVQTADYQVNANTVAGFVVQPITPFQLNGLAPGALADLMRFYEMGHVMSATVKTTFISREAGAAESLSIVAALANSRDLVRTLDINSFSSLQSMPYAQTKFIGPTSGGGNQATFTHHIQIQTPATSSTSSSVTSIYDGANNYALTPPVAGVIADSPMIFYQYTPITPAQCQFTVTRRIVFNFYFSRPHYPRAPFTANNVIPGVQPPDDFHREMDEMSMEDTISRCITKQFKKLTL